MDRKFIAVGQWTLDMSLYQRELLDVLFTPSFMVSKWLMTYIVKGDIFTLSIMSSQIKKLNPLWKLPMLSRKVYLHVFSIKWLFLPTNLYIQHGSKITTTFRKLFFRDIQTNDYIYSRQQIRACHTVPVLCIAIDLTIQILRQLSTLFIGTRAWHSRLSPTGYSTHLKMYGNHIEYNKTIATKSSFKCILIAYCIRYVMVSLSMYLKELTANMEPAITPLSIIQQSFGVLVEVGHV